MHDCMIWLMSVLIRCVKELYEHKHVYQYCVRKKWIHVKGKTYITRSSVLDKNDLFQMNTFKSVYKYVTQFMTNLIYAKCFDSFFTTKIKNIYCRKKDKHVGQTIYAIFLSVSLLNTLSL
jgi:hypothetical protein